MDRFSALCFLALAAFSVCDSGISDIPINIVGQKITAAVRIDLARRMLTAPFAVISRARDLAQGGTLVLVILHDLSLAAR